MCAERRRRRPRRSRFKKFLMIIEIFLLLMLAVTIGAVGGAFIGVSKLLPVGSDIENFEPTETTKIYSSDGVLLAEVYEENREFVPIEDIPTDLKNATVAIEDARFYKHFGVDFIGIGRAVYQNFAKRRMAQGASTLTQQLARNIYLTREKKLSRKLQEMVLAIQIERNYSKDQILELYLNQVFYGSGSFGVQTASKTYFGKDVKDLTLAECALLAGLPQRPTGYTPYKSKEAAISRRNVVLKRMAELGYITSEQCEDAQSEDIKLIGLKTGGVSKYKAPWFVSYVLKDLEENHNYGPDMIYKGGLRVYTTLNYEMQQIAERALREQVKEAKWRKVTQGAMVCIDPHTGYIRAMVGSVKENYVEDQYNRAVQAKRQPGSAFKAFVYTAAIDNGYDPDYRLPNRPLIIKGKPWPKNYTSRQSAGSYSIREAIKQSINIPAVRMAETIGIDKVITYAQMLGIKSQLHPNLSLALGADVVTPLEMCSAYGVFAAEGMRAEPMSVIRITATRGRRTEEVLAEFHPQTRRVLSEQTAATMSEMFRQVVVGRGGTGYAAARVPNAHGKTGTTSDDRDAWFVGYTPELATAVWVGNDNYSIPMRSVWGGNVCAPAWATFMSKGIEIHKKELEAWDSKDSDESDADIISESKPDGSDAAGKPARESGRTVTICAESGQRAVSACPTTYKTQLSPGESLGYCTVHGRGRDNDSADTEANVYDQGAPAVTPAPADSASPGNNGEYIDVTICVDSGSIANEYCPQTITKRYLISESPRRICRYHRPPE